MKEVSDDFAADTDTTGTVSVGGSTIAEIDYRDDIDWFKVELEADKTYRFDLEGARTDTTVNKLQTWLGGLYLRGIYDANGDPIDGATNDRSDYRAYNLLTFTAQADGVYYVAASQGRERFLSNRWGTYELSVTDVTDSFRDDYTVWTDTDGRVSIDGYTTGEIESVGDRDWFAVTLEAGVTYRFDLEGASKGAGTLGYPYLRGIHDAAGNLIDGTTRDNRVTFTPTESATYYVAAGGGWSTGWTYRKGTYSTGTYRLSVMQIDDYTADTQTGGAVSVGGSTTGEIESEGDRDWFAVTLKKGATYRIELEGSATAAGTLTRPYLSGIHDANGTFLPGTMDDGLGSYSRLTFTAPEAGIYYLSAAGVGDRQGTYGLSVRQVDDYSASALTGGTVAVGGRATGEIETPGDRDWFAMTLEGGKSYRIDLDGAPTGGGTLGVPVLRGIHDAAGDFIAGTTPGAGTEGDRNSRVYFTAPEGGLYHVSTSGYAAEDGTYTLSLTEEQDDLSDTVNTAGAVGVGGTATGAIDFPGDRDWFKVELEADKSYRFDLAGTGTDALIDPYLRGIHDASGDLIADTTDDNGGEGFNSRVTFTPAAAGVYYVAAGGNWPGTGAYTLSVAEVQTGNSREQDSQQQTSGEQGSDETGDDAGNTVRQEEAPVASDSDAARAGAAALGDITGLDGPRFPRGTLDGDGDAVDYWSFTLTAAKEVGLGLRQQEKNADLYLEDAEGNVLHESARDGTANEWLAATLLAGTYYVRLEAREAGESSYVFRYGVSAPDGDEVARLEAALGTRQEPQETQTQETQTQQTAEESVSETAGSDLPGDTSTTGRVAVGGSVTGKIDTDGARDWYDSDWFAVTLEAGKSYRVDLEGRSTGAGTLRDPYLYGIYDAEGDPIGSIRDDNGGEGWNSRVEFALDAAGTYYLAAEATDTWTGTYTLSVEEVM